MAGFDEAHRPDGPGLRLFDGRIVEFKNEAAVEADDMVVVPGFGSFVKSNPGTALECFLEQPGLTQGLHVPVNRSRTDFGMVHPDFPDQFLDLEMPVMGKGDGCDFPSLVRETQAFFAEKASQNLFPGFRRSARG